MENLKNILENSKIINLSLNDFSDELLAQIKQTIDRKSTIKMVLLPDLHFGQYFPVGCVVITKDKIYPHGLGFDINCGVRISKTTLFYDDIKSSLDIFADVLYKNISVGSAKEQSLHNKNLRMEKNQEIVCNKLDQPNNVKSEVQFSQKIKHLNVEISKNQISLKLLNEILDNGIIALKKNNLVDDELDRIESNGSLEGNSRLISQKAKGKGISQLCSLGSGNHYLEIQRVEKIFCKKSANKIGIKENQILFSIHTGSRGLGHQITSEFNEEIDFNSLEGKKYISSMNSASNFAFANRSLIAKKVSLLLNDHFNCKSELIYDVSHNIIKEEVFNEENVFVHRKGASLCFNENIPFNLEGQPVPVGGSMGTASYLLVGLSKSKNISFSSCCHGSGRKISRIDCRKRFTNGDLIEQMNEIYVRYLTNDGLIEEIPQAYKDIDEVVNKCEEVGIVKRIAKVVPILVIKG